MTSPATTTPSMMARSASVLAVEHACATFEPRALLARDLRDGALGREVAVEHGEMAVGLDRVRQRPNDRLPGRIRLHRREVLGDRAARDREAAAVQHAGVEQRLLQRLNAADADQLRHQVAAARPQVGEHGRAIADAREVGERELDARLVRDREQVQHGVRRAAERNDRRDRVLERFLAQDVRRLDAALDQRHDGLAGAAAVVGLGARHGLLRGAVREAQARALRSPTPSCWPCTCRRRSPGPGIAVDSTSLSSASSILPAA